MLDTGCYFVIFLNQNSCWNEREREINQDGPNRRYITRRESRAIIFPSNKSSAEAHLTSFTPIESIQKN